MSALEKYVGQVLDDKYRLEQLLGQGGMGAVYLATHLGTERYVALKLISPQFMRNSEFVERFKREARAAGRLRHPNVVDVTDFGFARVKEGQVAYLVMEYLDGCTLGDVLAEEKRLPLEWVADIMEQVCSAVHEAHQQGIIHRDLKPDNIWLEPNRLGGYRVKVLDFGIAKLGPTAETAPRPTTTRRRRSSMTFREFERRQWPRISKSIRCCKLAPADETTHASGHSCRRRWHVVVRSTDHSRTFAQFDDGAEFGTHARRRDHGHAAVHVAGAMRRRIRRYALGHLQSRRDCLSNARG